jgi:hypothetical protein
MISLQGRCNTVRFHRRGSTPIDIGASGIVDRWNIPPFHRAGSNRFDLSCSARHFPGHRWHHNAHRRSSHKPAETASGDGPIASTGLLRPAPAAIRLHPQSAASASYRKCAAGRAGAAPSPNHATMPLLQHGVRRESRQMPSVRRGVLNAAPIRRLVARRHVIVFRIRLGLSRRQWFRERWFDSFR